MTSNNIDIVLTNALCCSANKANELSDLLSKGSLCIESKVRELKILNDSINLLKCYNFGNTANTILTIGSTTFNMNGISVTGKTYNFNINGIIYNINGDNVTKIFILLNDLLKLAGYYISSYYNINSDNGIIIYTLNCNIINLTVSVTISNGTTIIAPTIINQIGNCIPISLNCITEDQMIFLTNRIMKYCDICECQLK